MLYAALIKRFAFQQVSSLCCSGGKELSQQLSPLLDLGVVIAQTCISESLVAKLRPKHIHALCLPNVGFLLSVLFSS